MPIKFRCNYCRQFLGISRAQAGGIVDCPTCGRSIRVPQLDGTLQPLPTPELNLQDAHLARALDELARLAGGDSQFLSQDSERAGDAEEDENEIPQPIPEPIPIEVPIPPTPIAIQPAMQDDDVDVPAAGESGNPDRAAVARGIANNNVFAELAALMPPEPLPGQDGTRPVTSPAVDRRQLAPRTSIPYALLMTLLAFVGGMLFERFVKVLESLTSTTAVAEKPADVDQPPEVSDVTGRITYKSADGTSQPDRGARVLVFPLEKSADVKLSVVGFRPADTEADAKVASASLKALGGALASADDDGRFRADVPAGAYQILVLSHFQSRDEQDPVDPAVRKLIALYFDKPDDLLGRIQFHFGPLKVKGTGDVWDHSF